MSLMEPVLERNRAFAARGDHEGVTVFPDLRVMVLTCLDPRVEPAAFLGITAGEAMVLRNAGGRVDDQVIRDVAFIGMLSEAMAAEGPLFEVAIVHHTQCGTGALADPSFRGRYAERIGADADELAAHAVVDPDASVAADVEKLRSRGRDPGTRQGLRPRLRRRDGLVHTVVPAAPVGAVAR